VTSIPQPERSDQPNASDRHVVLGVDTHKDIHVAAVLTVLGVVLGSATFPTTAAGYRRLLAWARGLGTLQQAGVECTGSYGKALARHLRGEGVKVTEVNSPDKATRRRRGKNDTIDAEAAARAVLSGRATTTPKAGDGPVEMARMFKLAKASAIKSRTQAINQLKSILVSADPELRETLAGLSYKILVRRCAALATAAPTTATGAAVYTLRLLAQRIQSLSTEIRELEKQLTAVITTHAPALLERHGVGPDSAATLLITVGDNPERLASEASLAALCGASPVEASSGKTERLRLNRGGDRQANAALYRVVLTRLRWDPHTRAYLDRRIREGKSRREAIRCLKRYVVRELYPLLRATRAATQPSATTA
jgi:transposase